MKAKVIQPNVSGTLNFGVALVLFTSLALTATLMWGMLQSQRQSTAAQDQLAVAVPRIDGHREYASSNRCQACHPAEHASWQRTFHRSMTQVAGPTTVVGRFDGTTIDSDGLLYTVYRKGAEFWVEMPDPEELMYAVQGGKRIDDTTYLIKRDRDSPIERFDLRSIRRVHRQVVLTTGSHHYQTYWVRGADKFGNLLQTVPLVYLIKDERWIPRDAAFMTPPEDKRLVTQWNHHCIRCHSTGGIPGLDRDTGKFDTNVGELGIACEACHGPGEAHIAANRDPLRRYRLHWTGEPDGSIVQPERLGHEASSQICGQCHGVYIVRNEFAIRYAVEGSGYRAGDDLFRTRYYIQHPAREPTDTRYRELQNNPDFFRDRWWEDGTVLAGGREFTAMTTTACYKQGQMSCLSCHRMHDSNPVDQLDPDISSVESCTQCHRDRRFTTEIEQHTHHSSSSDGSDCLNCHMPRTTYALFSAIRNHQISIPNLRSSAAFGVPNACNLCHLDRTLEWTRQYLDEWYGSDADVYLTAEQQQVAAAVIWVVKGDAAQRAITAWHFGWSAAQHASGREWLAPIVGQLLADPYGVVRYVARDALRTLPGFENLEYDFLADDEVRRASVDSVQQQWELQTRGSLESPRHVLFTDDGDLDRERLELLLRQRNDRPVTIKE